MDKKVKSLLEVIVNDIKDGYIEPTDQIISELENFKEYKVVQKYFKKLAKENL